MICSNVTTPLTVTKLGESQGQSNSQKYILVGPVAELQGKPNRNGRIYTKEEYLKHLAYLRDDIKKGEPLLGELDHPDDRFEVKLKEASHRIIDLWYDADKNVVMGKIELLNTPNGKLAQSIVDQGIPLHISSRAAGSVNADNTVSIQQIYTYDLVCKPGFANAVLHRVNESADIPAYTDDVKTFLKNSLKMESMNAAPQYGFLNEDLSVSEIRAKANLRNEAKEIQINNETELNINEMTKPLYENKDSLETSVDVLNSGSNTEDKDVKKQKKVSEDEAEDAAEDKKSDTADSDETKETEEKESENKETEETAGIKIIDVKAEFDETQKPDEMILDVNALFADETQKKADVSDDVQDGSKENPEETKQDESERTVDCKQDDKDKEETEKLYDTKKEADKLSKEVKSDIEERSDKLMKKLDDIRTAIEKKSKSKEESKNESLIMAQYPASMMMTESNFAQFTGLNDTQKNKVVEYLRDNNFTDGKSINENWKNGVNYVAETPTWLKYAPDNYRKLYESAAPSVKKSIETTASYLIFENQQDVNSFWENSGLQEAEERKLINESFVNTLPKVTEQRQEVNLPYSKAYIDQITAMACDYNRK